MIFRRLLRGNNANLYPSAIMLATDSQRLRIEIKNTQPVELLDLTNSLLAIGDQYKRFVARHYPEHKRDVKLVVREIRSGSIITELEPLTLLVPLIGNFNDLVQFGKYLRSFFDHLLHRDTPDQDYTKTDYNDASCIVAPVAKDQGAQYNISINGNDNAIILPILNTDSIGGNAIQNRAREEIRQLEQTRGQHYSKVLIYLEKANSKARSSTGTYGRSDALGHGGVKLLFENEAVREKMLAGDHNPFKSAFVVDLILETAFQKPAAYRILKVHDIIPMDEPDSDSNSDIALFDA